jgi:predicted nucleic acid-binding protein
MDLMLALTEDAVHELIWTDALLDEWERVIVREHHRTARSARRIAAAIRDFFADSQIPENSYVHLVDDMPSVDPDDRHHIAAAVVGNATVIVTWNRADFPAQPLATLGLRVANPDEYLQELLAQVPDEVVATVVRLADEKQNPPRSALDLIQNLTKAGVPAFADKVASKLRSQSGLYPPEVW